MLPWLLCSQVNTDNTQTVEWYVQNVLVGAGVAISNVQYNGGSAAVPMPSVGQFDNLPSGADIGLVEGMIMGSGDITLASQNNIGGGSWLGGTGSSGVDVDLAAITPNPIFDECIVEFDFISNGDSINFNYVFASEEYDEYVCGSVNDAFGFFLTGPDPSGGVYTAQNIALIPDPSAWPTLVYTSTPVSINTVNFGVPGSTAGSGANCTAIDPAWATYNIFYTQNLGTNYEYDGRTTVLPVKVPVICGQTYHIKLAIGDGGDGGWDSGVFLEKGSFSSNAISVNAEIANGDTILWEGCSEAYFAFSRPDTTVDFTVYFNVTGTATMGDDYTAIPDSLVMSAGTYFDTIFLYPLVDTIIESSETVTIEIYFPNCLGFDTISASLIINDYIPLTATMNILPVDPCSAPDSLLVELEFIGQGADSIHWDMGNGVTFIDDTIVNYYYTTQGTYYITMYAEDVCGNNATIIDTVVYIANYTQSNAIPPPDMLLCDPPFDVTFDAGAPAPPNAFWDFGDGSGISTQINPTYTYADTGSYTVMYVAIDSSTCNISDTAYLTITVGSSDPVIADFNHVVDCINMTVDAQNTGTPGSLYQWDMGDFSTYTTPTVFHTYASAGQYLVQLIVTDTVCGTADTISATIDIAEAVIADIEALPDSIGCIPFEITFVNNSNGVSYVWDFGDGSPLDTAAVPTHTYNSIGTFQALLIASDPSSCNLQDTTYITIVAGSGNPAVADFSYIQNVNCELFEVTATNLSTGDNLSYQWEMGDATLYTDSNVVHQYSSPGTYVVSLIAHDSVCSNVDTAVKVIVIQASLAVDIGEDQIICPYDQAVFDAGVSGVSYLWNTGDTTATISPQTAGMYTVIIHVGVCEATDTAWLSFTTYSSRSYTTEICMGEQVILDAGEAQNYLWITNESTGQISVDHGGEYWVQYTDDFGCIYEDTIVVVQKEVSTTVFAPNAFSPNADGHNDTWKVVGQGVEDYQLRIFNRWGELLWLSTSIDDRWDGTYQGSPIPIGVYVYKFSYHSACAGSGFIEKTGHIFILK